MRQFVESLKKWGSGASGVFYCLATRSWLVITQGLSAFTGSWGHRSHRQLTQCSPLPWQSPPISPWKAAFAILLAQSKSLPFLLQFLRPLNVELKCHSVFYFQKKGYWYESYFLVSFRKVLLRLAFFSGHLSSSPFRTRTQRPQSFQLTWVNVYSFFFCNCLLGRIESPHFIECQEWPHWLLASVFS